MTEDKENNIFSDEDELWNIVTKNDKKYKDSNYLKVNKILKNFKNKVKQSPVSKIKNKSLEKKENIKTQQETILTTTAIYEDLSPEKIPSGISLRQAEKLKRGKIKPDVSLDLHGYTAMEAKEYITNKITQCYKNNTRCILIITGKKFGSKGSEGVLRKEVPNWLNNNPLRELVLMTSWAKSQHGGQGALYVLLKNIKRSQ